MEPESGLEKRPAAAQEMGEELANEASIEIRIDKVRRSRMLVRPENEGHPVKDPGFHSVRSQAPSSNTDQTAVSGRCDDAGDSDQLQDLAVKKKFDLAADSTAYAGTSFTSTIGLDRPASLPDDFQDEEPHPLDVHIRGCVLNAAGQEGKEFLPLSELKAIITIPHIAGELKRSSVSADVHRLAQQVLKETCTSDSNITTRRKLFAILCHMDKAASIEDFIEENIFDADLPFEFDLQEVHRRSNSKTSNTRIALFGKWKNSEKDSFKNYQGKFLAPYFKFGTDSEASFRKYPLHHCVVLPFVEIEDGDSAYSPHVLGGFSEVRKVKIHTAHYDHAGSSVSEKAYFAVKEIRKSESVARFPNRETDAYRLLNPIGHSHIVRLLAEYVQNGHVNLIFPWADGNLFQFWKKHYPKMENLTRGHLLSKWLSKQFKGLSSALVLIHDLSSCSLTPKGNTQNHGRHGDFKPENILWYRDPSGSGPIGSLGTLMISDLGSTEFHGTLSKYVHASTASAHTETYKAPEFDKMAYVSPKADIWSFACVLMEFIVWYILGQKGIDDFAKARKDDSNLWFHGDHFFNYNKFENTVTFKPSVLKEFSMLQESATSDFILDLLSIIELRMLRLRPEERATCKEIEGEFSALHERCIQDVRYCTNRTQNVILRSSTDLSDKVSVSFSPQQQEEWAGNILATSQKSSRSVAPSDDDRSGMVGTGEEGSSTSRVLVSGEQQNTSAEDVQTRPFLPRVRRHHDPLSPSRRAWNKCVKVIKGCFKSADDT